MLSKNRLHMHILAKELDDKTVTDKNGQIIGQLHNITIDFKTGSLKHLLVTPEGGLSQQKHNRSRYNSDDKGRFMVDSAEVRAVKDQIVVE